MSRRRGKRAGKAAKKTSQPASTQEPAPPPARSSGELGWALGLVLLAWIHRLAFLHSNEDRAWPYTLFYEGDGETFFKWARAMLQGELYDNGVPFHPPGFPAFLAVLHELLGTGAGVREIPHLTVKTVLALVASLSVGLIYLLARPYLGRFTALLTGLLCTYHFGLYVIAVATVSEGLYLTLLFALLLLWSRNLEHPLKAPPETPPLGPPKGTVSAAHPRWSGLALGAGLGYLALVRVESALVAALLVTVGLVGWWRRRPPKGGETPRRPWRLALVPWILVGVGWLAVVAPWTARNARRLGELNERIGPYLAEPLPTFVPVTIYGPLNLALANQDGADGTFSPDALMAGTGSGQLSFTNPRHLEYVLHGDRIAFEWIRTHPGGFARLVLRKWGLAGEAFKLGFTQWDWPGGLDGVRRPVDMFVPKHGVMLWVLPPLALLGLVTCFLAGGERRRWAILVTLLLGITLVVTGLFYGYVRQGVLVLPLALSLVAAGPVWIAERLSGAELRRPPRRAVQVLAVLALALLSLELWGARGERRYQPYQDAADMIDGVRVNRDLTIRLEVLPWEAPGPL